MTRTFNDGITKNTPAVLAQPAPGGQLSVGDTGVVVAAWLTATVLVRWDKDQKLRSVRRKRLALRTDQGGTGP